MHALGVLFALIAAVGLLAGCGGSSKKSSSSTTSASTAGATSSSTAQPRRGHDHVVNHQTAAPAAAAAGWTQPNGNLAGTRDVVSSITSSNVSKLGVAWKVPITGNSASASAASRRRR